jgi:Zn finger protein HypA/HybF involved in hydrogenase expression
VIYTFMVNETGPRLAELAGQDVPVAAWCLGCGHHRVLAVGDLLARMDGRTAVAAVARRLSCSRCGSRAIETRPHYAGLGVVAGHRWHEE